MTAMQVQGVAVVSIEPVETPLSGKLRTGKDGVRRPGPVMYYRSLVRLVLADGRRNFIGCCLEGCEYFEEERQGYPSPIQRISIWHGRDVHGKERRPYGSRTKKEADLPPALQFSPETTIGELQAAAQDVATLRQRYDALIVANVSLSTEIKRLRREIDALRVKPGVKP